MSYRTRSARRVVRKSKYSFILTIVIILVLLYAAIFWILPNLIGGVGFIKNILHPSATKVDSIKSSLAPPVINIPFEATNSAQIDIKGYATPGSKVNIYIDDNLKTSVKAGEDGSFNAKSTELNWGTNNIYGKTEDENNQESLPSKTIQIIFNNQKPKLDISSPTDGQVVKGDKKVTVSGQTDPGNIVSINGNQIIINSDGSFQSSQNLNDGDNSLTIQAMDNASNINQVTRKVTSQP